MLAVRIYSDNIGMEFGMGKCAILVMKNGKQKMTEGIELQKEKSERSEKRKCRDTLEYWTQTPSNKWR